jgi:hypothetical protein
MASKKLIAEVWKKGTPIRGNNPETWRRDPEGNKVRKSSADLRAEYRFDYRKAKPNRFAKRMAAGTIAVVLEPDVAAVFSSSESVNNLLRSVIAALPHQTER